MTDAPLDTLDPTLSHTRGETETALIEETIGDNLDTRWRGSATARRLVDVAQRAALDLPGVRQPTSTGLARALLARRVQHRRPGGHLGAQLCGMDALQYATAKIGAILVNINPAYRSHELRYVLEQAGHLGCWSPPSVQDSRLRAMVESVAAECPT